MQIEATPLKDCLLVKNQLFEDSRGYFFESFNTQKFKQLTGWKGEFVQDNQSSSTKGVVRGLHFQTGNWAQAKLVRVLQGTVCDTVVDLRPESETFGKVFSLILDENNSTQLFIPRGFAHGFSVLSNRAVFFYKCDNFYEKSAEGSIHPFDKYLNIDWKIPEENALLSEKDSHAPRWPQFLASLGL